MKKAKIFQARSSRSLLVGILFGLVTAFLLILAAKNEKKSAIDKVLIVVAGMTTIASLAAFEQFRESETQAPSGEIYFNEPFVSSMIFEKLSLEKDKSQEVPKPKSLPWDLSLGQLVSEDNSLGLARLRIEIEQEIRRIAYSNKIDINNRPLGVLALTQELVSRKILPSIWLEALRDIVSVCDRAIHGAIISDDTANSVVRVGIQLLEQLRLLSAKDDSYISFS
jgi:hypothetical protein